MLDKLIEQSKEYDSRKSDYRVEASELHFEPDGSLHLNAPFGVVPLTPTTNAYNQVFDRLGEVIYGSPLPRNHMLRIPKELMSYDLNYLMPKMDQRNRVPWLIRGYESTARAALTTSYAQVDNTRVMQVVDDAVKHGTFKIQEIHRPDVNPDSIHLRVTATNLNTGDGPYGLGAYIRNDEIGGGRVEVKPYIKRGKCDNTIIFPEDANYTSRVHRGSVQAILSQMYFSLQDAFKLSATWLQRLLDADRKQLPDFEKVIESIASKHGWGTEIKEAIAFGAEGRDTVAGLVHGISYVAHAKLEGDARIEAEELAGQFLKAMTRTTEEARWQHQGR